MPSWTTLEPQVRLLSNPWDAVRWVSVAACLAVAATTVATIIHPMLWHQRARIVGAAMLAVGIIAANLTSLGTTPPQWWRTLLITAGVVLLAVGMVALARHQRHTEPPPPPTVRTVDRLGGVPAAVVVADATSRIVAAAGQPSALLGWTADQLTGRPLASIIPDQYRADHFTGLQRLATTGETRVAWQRLELAATHRDHREVPVNLLVAPLPGGRFLGVLTTREP